MGLEVGINSYISTTDADIYFTDRLNSEVWTGENKSQALIQATMMIDFKKYKGVKTSSSQSLSFPRMGLYDDGSIVDGATVPKKIRDATCELALYLLQEDYSEPDDLAGFESIKVGSIQVTTKTASKSLPPFVNSLLKFTIASSCKLYRG